MEYQEFVEKIGKITVPEGEINNKLIHGIDSIHFVCIIGKVRDGEYEVYSPVPKGALLCLKVIDILESRGAWRDKDYIVSIYLHEHELRLGVHSTHDFLSDDDFDDDIKRYYTK